MSVSKLECLPNELFIEIFEKYLNGVDILTLISCFNTARFIELVQQCRYLYFDFRHCRKDSFHLCLNFPLMDVVEKIEELFLSDQNAPGQTKEFLSIFPSFAPFQRLRKLHFHVDFHSANWPRITRAIHSLSETPVDTVLFEVTNTEREERLDQIINGIIGLQTIKRFSFTSDAQPCYSFPIITYCPTLEYLKYSDMACDLENLRYIFECFSHLKYLDIQLASKSYLGVVPTMFPFPIWTNTISTPNLHTLILSFMPRAEVTMNELTIYLRSIPTLQRLEIKAVITLLDAPAWQILLQTSLPSLTHFRLKSTTSRVRQDQIEGILASFETQFWIDKTNFYLIITEHKIPDSNSHDLNNILIDDRDEFLQPVTRWWIVPTRARIDDIPTKDIIHIGITNAFKYLSDYYYFKNVKHLIIFNLDSDLLQCLSRCVNSIGIEHLDVSFFDHASHSIISLLSHLKNMASLRIRYTQLIEHRTVYLEKSNELKYLDISIDNHSFSANDILTISKLFPKLECLAIKTKDLSNVPLLKTHFPHLRTLTFRIMNYNFSLHHRPQKLWDRLVRKRTKSLFHIHDNFTTVWIDQPVFEDSYWEQSQELASVNYD